MQNLITELPGPEALLFNEVAYVFYAMYCGLMLWEALMPARKLPLVPFWQLKGLLFFIVFFLLSSYLPLLWDGWLSQYQLFNLQFLGKWGGALIGLLLYELGEYVWHRNLHKRRWLWQTAHQMHHSAERLDTYGAFFFSPLDMLGWTALSSFCLVFIAGFTPEATTLSLLATNFLSIFQHANIHTPVWLGYLIQRPEAHHIHHARGIHAGNYSGLPIYDLIFGTFRKTYTYQYETGFYTGASARLLDMLRFRDVSKPGKQ